MELAPQNAEGARRQPLDRAAAVLNKTPNLPRNDLRVRDPPVYLRPTHISPQLARLDLASPVWFDAEGGRGGSEAGASFPSLPAGPIQNAKRGQRGPRLIYPTGNHPSYSVRPKNRVGAKQPGYSGGCNSCGRQGHSRRKQVSRSSPAFVESTQDSHKRNHATPQ